MCVCFLTAPHHDKRLKERTCRRSVFVANKLNNFSYAPEALKYFIYYVYKKYLYHILTVH